MRKNQLAMIDIDLKKIKRLQKAMKKAPKIIEEELGLAVRDLTLFVHAEAKQMCPVDTGNLRASITPVVESWARAYIGTNVEYAPYVEYGTRNMAAQPYLEPAFLKGKEEAPKIFDQAIERALARIDKEAK